MSLKQKHKYAKTKPLFFKNKHQITETDTKGLYKSGQSVKALPA